MVQQSGSLCKPIDVARPNAELWLGSSLRLTQYGKAYGTVRTSGDWTRLDLHPTSSTSESRQSVSGPPA